MALDFTVGGGNVLGRYFAYNSVRLIGTTRAVPIQSSYILIAVILSVIFFDEPLTLKLALALLLVVSGIVILSLRREAGAPEVAALPARSRVRGIVFALSTAVCWGVSPVLVKFGLAELDSPALATFTSDWRRPS